MSNKDLFREWYISQINPQTGKSYVETSVSSYIAAIQRLVAAGLVGPDIFDVDLEGFTLQIGRAQKEHPAAFAAQEHHGNLKNGIKWWKMFLETRAKRVYISLKDPEGKKDLIVVDAPAGSLLRHQLEVWARTQTCGGLGLYHVVNACGFLCDLICSRYSEGFVGTDQYDCARIDALKVLHEPFQNQAPHTEDGCWVNFTDL